ncbi:hypothetical protein [Geobacter sp. AOG2]|uniref:hypothetical protein n=1 Tax=Geobacter sp. AOG2 TaxID=1566347 RepID=UPI001CC57713|nr:hypothetical protein [Geobacter sp. AOG2]GFE60599.1 hypothetical protein AOG2_11870 [Geobacter sp. AOG2]
MSLKLSPEGQIDRRILQAVAAAIRSIETLTGTIEEYDIGVDDAELLASALGDLWSILETNGCTTDFNSNRLRRTNRDN